MLVLFCRVQVTKQRDQETGQHSLLFQIDYPEIADGVRPRHRFMSAYEQHQEAPDKVRCGCPYIGFPALIMSVLLSGAASLLGSEVDQ